MSVLTEIQERYLVTQAQRFAAEPGFDAEVARRRGISDDFRSLIAELRVTEGALLSHDDAARIVAAVWKIQNLNAIVLPQFLGTFTYYRAFKGFEGDRDAFVEHMESSRPGWKKGSAGYEGADLTALSASLRAMLTADVGAFGPAYLAFVALPGAARALASGVAILWAPDTYPLINNASIGPFKNQDGPLYLGREARAALREAACDRFGVPRVSRAVAGHRDMGWMVLMDEVRETCGFTSYFEVDWLLWRMTKTTSAGPRLDDIIERGIAALTARARTR